MLVQTLNQHSKVTRANHLASTVNQQQPLTFTPLPFLPSLRKLASEDNSMEVSARESRPTRNTPDLLTQTNLQSLVLAFVGIPELMTHLLHRMATPTVRTLGVVAVPRYFI